MKYEVLEGSYVLLHREAGIRIGYSPLDSLEDGCVLIEIDLHLGKTDDVVEGLEELAVRSKRIASFGFAVSYDQRVALSCSKKLRRSDIEQEVGKLLMELNPGEVGFS
jgi:hypothetical protein